MTQDERWNIYGSWLRVNGSILTLMEIEAGGKEYLRTDDTKKSVTDCDTLKSYVMKQLHTFVDNNKLVEKFNISNTQKKGE